MKTLLLALCLAVATVVHAAPPAPPTAVSIEIEMHQPKSATETTYSTSWGSYDKNFAAQRTARVKLKMVGEFDRAVTVKWAFIARGIRGGLYAWDSGTASAEIKKGGTDIEIISKELTGADQNLKAIDVRSTSGGKPHGFALVVMQGGRVIASKESSVGLIALMPVEKK